MYKLLVVDDEAESRNLLCSYFPWNEMGFDIIAQLDNGKEAFEFLEKNLVDVILCDLLMPVMSGIELARELHRKKDNVKIIFLSGYQDFESAREALSLGVKDYIVKPSKYKDLLVLFARIKEELDAETGSPAVPAEALTYNEKIISSIKEYVVEYYKHATLEEISKKVHMNPNYLSQFFKQKTGQNFSDYLISVKMDKAAEMLRDIKYKNYEVSELVGYSNANNFSRIFKRHFGLTPREYRSQNLGINL